MMEIGNRVRVTDGEHHGKTGTVVSVSMHHTPNGGLRVMPVVSFKDGAEEEILGSYLTIVR